MTAIDALDELSNAELDTLAAGIEAGSVPSDRVDRIAGLLADADITELDRLADEKPAIVTLIQAVEAATDEPIVPVALDGADAEPVPTEAERTAVDEIERLLMPTGGRDPDFFFRLREALETGDAGFTRQVTQDVLDAISAEQRERLADRAGQLARETAVSDMTRRDFPAVEQATDRASGRTVADYWRPLLEELERADPTDAPILRDAGVSDDQIEALFANSNVRNEFIEKVEDNIAAITGDGQPGTGDVPERIEGLTQQPPPAERRLTGFQKRFINLTRDVGWCDVLPCRDPDRYFDLPPEQQQTLFQLTPEGFLSFWVAEGLVSRGELRDRGFSDDVIPS